MKQKARNFKNKTVTDKQLRRNIERINEGAIQCWNCKKLIDPKEKNGKKIYFCKNCNIEIIEK